MMTDIPNDSHLDDLPDDEDAIRKGLTIRQPNAWLIVNGYKPIENRIQNSHWTKTFFIHAGAEMTLVEYRLAVKTAVERGVNPSVIPPVEEMRKLCGGIVGKAVIRSVLPKIAEPTVPWHESGRFGFVLDQVSKLPFFPCQGAQGWWNAQGIWRAMKKQGLLAQSIS